MLRTGRGGSVYTDTNYRKYKKMHNRMNTSSVIDRYLNTRTQPLQVFSWWQFRTASMLFMFIYNLFLIMQVFKVFQSTLVLNFPVFIMLEDNWSIPKTVFTLG